MTAPRVTRRVMEERDNADQERPGGSGETRQGDPAREARKPADTARGAESYGGDPDAEPSVTEDEVQTGLERDQAEG
jgi:hypothetical protein